MPSLEVDFCGIRFPNPFMLSSAPPTTTGSMIARAFDAGWGGAVTKTLVLDEKPIRNVTPRLTSLAFPGFEGEPKKIYALENIELASDRPLSVWLAEITDLAKRYPANPVVASIMADASRKAEWQELARRCEGAGARAIELNFSCPHGGMPGTAVGRAIGQDPGHAGRITGWAREVVRVPLLVKLTPNVSDIVVIAKAAKEAGADGVTAINSVAAIPGVDLDTLVPLPSVQGRSAQGGLCGPAIKPIALRLVSELARGSGLPVSGCGGIGTWQDAAEFALLGASTLQVCTAVMLQGCGIVQDMRDGLLGWMEEKGFSKLSDFVGLANGKLTEITELDHATRLVSSVDASTCVKCDICHVACRDGGYQAITVGADRIPIVDESHCSGCGLCVQACPVWNCMTMKARAA